MNDVDRLRIEHEKLIIQNYKLKRKIERMREKITEILECYSREVAAKQEGFNYIGIEMEAEYIEKAEARLAVVKEEEK